VIVVVVVCFASLADLEHTRDELFIQLYHSEDAFVDKNTVSLPCGRRKGGREGGREDGCGQWNEIGVQSSMKQSSVVKDF